MAIIKKKTWPALFEKILSGSKTFDLRTADFDIQENDTLVLQEWDPKTKDYTGREIEKKVGFVGKWKLKELEEFWPKKDIEKYGLQVISLHDIKK
jgi:hypothetical protein